MNVLLALRGMMNRRAYPSNSEPHDFLCLAQNFGAPPVTKSITTIEINLGL